MGGFLNKINYGRNFTMTLKYDAALNMPLCYDAERPYIDWVAARQLLVDRGVL